MASRISSSKFLQSTVVRETIVKHLNDPIRSSGGPLPDNIKSGVAKLLEVWFDKDEQDRESFRATAEVVLPELWGGEYIKGRITRQWVPYNVDTIEDAIIRIQTTLVGLGGKGILGNGHNVDLIKVAEFLTAATKNKPIYFGFGTSPKKQMGPVKLGEDGQPATVWPWENWYAAIPNFREPSVGSVIDSPVQKKTSVNSVSNGHTHSPSTQNHASSMVGDNDPAPWTERLSSPISGAVVDDVYSDSEDLDSLIKRATNKDKVAQDKLEEFAKSLGYSEDDVAESESWEQVGEWIKSGKTKDTAGQLDDMLDKEKEPVPKRMIKPGEVYDYCPPNKKDSTQRLKERLCKVVSVDEAKRTCKIYNLVKKNEEYEVSWDDEFLK